MKDIKTILVPLDFSDCAPGVVQRAAQLASQLDAAVVVMHAVAKPHELPGAALIQPTAGSEPVSVIEHLRRGAASRLPKYKAIIEAEGARAAEGVVIEGDAVEAILTAADRLGADLIVMGTHGRVGLRRMMLGSVAESVLRQAVMPVLTVRSIHRATCDASSCQSCTSHISQEALDVRAELDG